MPAVDDPRTLKTIPLFEGLPDEDLQKLNDLLHKKTFPARRNIMEAETPGEAIYIVLEGTVKIYVDKVDGTEVILALLGAGDTVGEMSLMDSLGHSASVITMEKTTFLMLGSGQFWHCLKTMSELTNNMLRVLSGRLRLANEQVLALSTLDVNGRVARQILAFSERYGRETRDGDRLIPLRLTQTDLANIVGASRERVNHTMVFLKGEDYISVKSNYHIVVHNEKALQDRARG